MLGGINGQGVQLFARLEANGFAWGDADLGAGARVAADAGFAGTDAEDAEAPELDAIAGSESVFQTFEDCIDGCLSLGSRQACPFDHVVDNILLDQCRRLIRLLGMLEYDGALVAALLGGMLGELTHVVNPSVLQYH